MTDRQESLSRFDTFPKLLLRNAETRADGTAYREKVFPQSPRPFLGYLFMLEDAPGSTRSVAVSEKHFPVLETAP